MKKMTFTNLLLLIASFQISLAAHGVPPDLESRKRLRPEVSLPVTTLTSILPKKSRSSTLPSSQAEILESSCRPLLESLPIPVSDQLASIKATSLELSRGFSDSTCEELKAFNQSQNVSSTHCSADFKGKSKVKSIIKAIEKIRELSISEDHNSISDSILSEIDELDEASGDDFEVFCKLGHPNEIVAAVHYLEHRNNINIENLISLPKSGGGSAAIRFLVEKTNCGLTHKSIKLTSLSEASSFYRHLGFVATDDEDGFLLSTENPWANKRLFPGLIKN